MELALLTLKKSKMSKCKYCGKDIISPDPSKFPNGFCSYRCYEWWVKFNKTPNCKCVVCGKEMYLKPYRLNRLKNGITCSIECASKLKSEYSKGEKNHQFGLTGDLNSSFKGEEILRANNSLTEVMVYSPNHPYKNQNGRVKKHRLIVEQNYFLFDEKYFEMIDNQVVLKPEVEIHHKDGNHDNNEISNLIPLTKSEHMSIHSKLRAMKLREKAGKYDKLIGVLKQVKMLEDSNINQQSIDSTTKNLIQQLFDIVGDDIV